MVPTAAICRGAFAILLLALLALPAVRGPGRAQAPTPIAATTVVPTVAPTPTKTAAEVIGVDQPLDTGRELLVSFGVWGTLGLLLLMIVIGVLAAASKQAGAGIGEFLYRALLGRRLDRRVKALDEQDRQHEEAQTHQQASEHGMAAYLRWLQEEIRYLPQIPLDQQQQQDLTLREVYVPLRVVERVQIDRFIDFTLGEFGAAGEFHARREAFGALEQSQQVYHLLSDSDSLPPVRDPDQPGSSTAELTTTRLLLVGDAGSGKTTTLHYGALMLAEDYAQRNSLLARSQLDLHCQDRLLPIYIRLTLALTYLREQYRADRARLTNGAAELLLEWVNFDLPRQVAVADFPPHLISDRIQAGGCLILLDGLDETGDASERDYVKLLINNLVQACPQNRYIVASRPFDGIGQNLHGFLERHLSPLNADEIDLLLRHWFSAIQRAESVARRGRRSADQEYEELWGNLDLNPRLFDMATNPLLLTSMAVLVHGGDPLPPERAKIYNRLIALTLVRWREAQIRAGQPPKSGEQPAGLFHLYNAEESDDDVRRRLQQLAAWMLQHQRREMPLREAQDLLAPVYEKNRKWLPEQSRNHVQALLRLLALHSGLIQERDHGYSFMHFTLLEYLTARDYDEHDNIAGLAQMWPEPRWRETILLAVGHWATSGYPQRAEKLLELLLQTGDIRALFLAAEALDEANARLVISLRGVLDATVAQLRAHAFDPVRCPEPRMRNQAAILLDRLGADDRPELGLLRPEYWAQRIEPGRFVMGDDQSQYENERPAFACFIRHSYALARFPATNRQYLAFLEDLERGGDGEQAKQRRPRTWPGSRYRAGEGNHPVVSVSWLDATAFAAWADQQLRADGVIDADQHVRLPTEPEWERAAAYPITMPDGDPKAGRRVYPWGDWLRDDELSSRIPANIDQSQIGSTSVAGIFPHGVAACGAQDMAGNMWAWCCTPYGAYPFADELTLHTSGVRQGEATYALRGGSWSTKVNAHCTYRYGGPPGLATDDVGFRLARIYMPVALRE
jgi:formylglycine-generating enzyme required for sulfatase activity